MKRRLLCAASLLLAFGARAQAPLRYPVVPMDASLPDVSLRDARTGKSVRLSDFKGKVLVGVFMSAFCNNTWKHDRRVEKLVADYKDRGVAFVLIHPTLYELDEDIIEKAKERGVDLPILDDKPRHELVQRLDIQNSPTFFVLDRAGVLRYKGGFDNNREPVVPYLQPVLDAMLAGKPLPYKQTTSFGCRISRRV